MFASPGVAVSNPAQALSERGDVSGMVTHVPGIKSQGAIQGDLPVFRVHVDPFPVVFGQRSKQGAPSLMDRIEQLKGNFERPASSVLEFRPPGLVIGLD